MNIKKHIPNAITCCNLLCGCLAIVQSFEGNLVNAAYLVGLAAIFDFFDGFAARMLKVSSPIGKDLDSLADMVTFGVVPGVVMFQMLKENIHLYINNYFDKNNLNERVITIDTQPFYIKYLIFVAFLITIFSAIRLAKFNNDTRQSDSFIGVPTPAVAIFICSLPLIYDSNAAFYFFHPLFFNPFILTFISIVLSFLLVSELPLFALKFKHFKWKENEIRFVFLGLSLVMLITLQFVGIPLIIIMYILLSVINNVFLKKKALS